MFLDVTTRVSAERALAESEQRRREILTSMLQAEEVERSRIATELHDDTVQVMAAALPRSTASRSSRRGPAANGWRPRWPCAGDARRRPSTRRLMFERVRRSCASTACSKPCVLLAGQIAREVGAHAEITGTGARFDIGVEEIVYRSAQEALANVRKHAEPRTITVTIAERDGMIESEIRDDGCGFDVGDVRSARPSAALHLGLDTMIERVRAAGGEIAIDSAPGAGTTVRSRCPRSRFAPGAAR